MSFHSSTSTKLNSSSLRNSHSGAPFSRGSQKLANTSGPCTSSHSSPASSLQQAQTSIMLQSLLQFGPSAGSREILEHEKLAAQWSIESKLYLTWRNERKQTDCARVGPDSNCFCGHSCASHDIWRKKGMAPCKSCKCVAFNYYPQRPEEIGEYWLTRRHNFDLTTWKAKCKCEHGSTEHDPRAMYCKKCSCGHFESKWLCLVCDGRFGEHSVVIESESERKMEGKSTGEDYIPFQEVPQLQKLVFRSKKKTKLGEARRRKIEESTFVTTPLGTQMLSGTTTPTRKALQISGRTTQTNQTARKPSSRKQHVAGTNNTRTTTSSIPIKKHKKPTK